jgi:helicase
MIANFWEVERAAAALSHGLESPLDWANVIAAARVLALQSVEADAQTADFSPLHFAAARALDNAAQFAPQTSPAQSRELGLWAAAAFAQSGNFPSSTTVVRRTFVRTRGQNADTSALLCALAPVLTSDLRAECEVGARLADFLISGDEKDAISVRTAWKRAVSNASAAFPRELWELAGRGLEKTLALATARVLSESGGNLPDGFAAKISSRVPVLLPPQATALHNGFLSDGGNALAALSPGSGKTLLGELFLAAALGEANEKGRWAVFVVPYLALGRGVAAAIGSHFPDEVQVHCWLGNGREAEADFSTGAHLVIATPERLDTFLRRHPQSWNNLRGAVFDEAHGIGDGARGARMEGLLTRLKMGIARQKKLRLLLLSAALGDFSELASWIGAEKVISSPFTPTARRLAFWRIDGRLEWHGDLSGRGLDALGTAHIAPPYPHLRATGDWPKMQRLEPLARQNVAHLAHRMWEERGGPILCLCATRRTTRELAFALGEKWEEKREITGHIARAIEAIEARHRTLLPLVSLLKRGIAWHNSSLPFEIRAQIEAGVADGEIAVVAATSTLAEGVDLPFRLTILADWLKWDEGGQVPISSALFRNIAGRCGRAGAFTEGDTLVFDNPLGDEKWTALDKRAARQEELYLSNELAPTRSALENVAFDSQMRSGIEATLETQLLAALGEIAPGSMSDAQFLDHFFAATFLATRNANSLQYWRERAAEFLTTWENQGLISRKNSKIELTARGIAWRASDLSPATCRRLLGALETLPDADFLGISGHARLNAHLWRAVGAVPESGSEIERFFASRSRFAATPADLESLGAAWLHGDSSEAIFAALPRTARSNYSEMAAWVEGIHEENMPPVAPEWSASYERWLDFVRAGLETWSPWLWRASAILAPLAGPNARKIDWRSGSLWWENGVDSLWASHAIAAGAPGTRAVIAAVGRLWPSHLHGTKGDTLGLAALSQNSSRELVEKAFETVLGEFGGRHCVAGRNVLALRDWVWAKAGLSK